MANETNDSGKNRESKRAQFRESRSGGNKNIIIGVIVLVIAVAAGFAVFSRSGDQPQTISAQPTSTSGSAPQDAGEVRVPMADLSTQARFFDYKTGDNSKVKFFVVKSSDGSIRAALDACEVCAHAKQGYFQEGTDMVCRNCTKRFGIDLIGTVSSGCHPIGLKTTADGSELVIRKSELESGRRYF